MAPSPHLEDDPMKYQKPELKKHDELKQITFSSH
jgi:hypothetical protein